MARAGINEFQEFRKKKLLELEEDKISSDEFANSLFGFIVQNKIKPIGKPLNRNHVILNYLYWVTFIERKVIMEQELITVGLGSLPQLKQAVKIYIKRQDKLIIKLFCDLKEKPAKILNISDNGAEIILNDGSVIICSQKILSEIGYHGELGESLYPTYSRTFSKAY